MSPEFSELIVLDERVEYTLVELAECSRLSESELQELIDCGVIAPRDSGAAPQRFAGRALTAARVAARLRDDFEIDLRGVALALALLERIDALETQLRQLRLVAPTRINSEPA